MCKYTIVFLIFHGIGALFSMTKKQEIIHGGGFASGVRSYALWYARPMLSFCRAYYILGKLA